MVEVGKRAPDFAVPDHTGRQVRLTDLKGKRAWLWFFTSPSGSNETNHGHRYHDHTAEFAARNISIYGVNDGNQETVSAWAQKEELPFPILLDPDRSLATAYGIANPDAPRYVANNAEGRRPAVVIDEDGIVLAVPPDLRSVEDQLEALAGLP